MHVQRTDRKSRLAGGKAAVAKRQKRIEAQQLCVAKGTLQRLSERLTIRCLSRWIIFFSFLLASRESTRKKCAQPGISRLRVEALRGRNNSTQKAARLLMRYHVRMVVSVSYNRQLSSLAWDTTSSKRMSLAVGDVKRSICRGACPSPSTLSIPHVILRCCPALAKLFDLRSKGCEDQHVREE